MNCMSENRKYPDLVYSNAEYQGKNRNLIRRPMRHPSMDICSFSM